MGRRFPPSLRRLSGRRPLSQIGRALSHVLSTPHMSRLSSVSEVDRPAGSASPAKRAGGVPPDKRSISEHTDLYQIAYEEGQRALDDQAGEIRGVRDRAVQFTVFVGAATAFLVGTGLQSAHRDAVFYTLASIASLLSAAMIALLIVVLGPSRSNLWHYRVSARSLINTWIETKVPPPSNGHFFRRLAEQYDDWRVKNEKLLSGLRKWYRWLIIVGSAQVTVWAALVWAKG